MHHEQPAVSMRADRRGPAARRTRQGKPGVAALRRLAARPGHDHAERRSRSPTRSTSSAGSSSTGVGRDLSLRQRRRDEGQPARSAWTCWPTSCATRRSPRRKSSGSGSRRCRRCRSATRIPDYVADAVFDRLVYGFHPYGLPGNGTPRVGASASRATIWSTFHRAYFAPNNCLLAVVGDITVDEAMAASTEAFGDWERRDVPAVDAGRPARADAPRRRRRQAGRRADRDSRRATSASRARRRTTWRVDLAIKILGGEGANRLHRVLRTERGLTYGARADTQTLKRAGEFVAETNTRSDATGEVLRLIVDEFSRLQRERVGDERAVGREGLPDGPLPADDRDARRDRHAGPQRAVLRAAARGAADVPAARERRRRGRRVQRVAWKYLRPDRLSVVLVGNAAAFLDQLKGVGFGKYEVVRLSELDLSAVRLQEEGRGSRESRQHGRGHIRPFAWGPRSRAVGCRTVTPVPDRSRRRRRRPILRRR